MESTIAEEFPINFTEKAIEKLLVIIKQEGLGDDDYLRLGVKGGGCAGFMYDLYFDNARDSDTQFTTQGVNVCIDMMSMMYLVGTTLDWTDELMGGGFKFSNPNVSASCGCAMSFST